MEEHFFGCDYSFLIALSFHKRHLRTILNEITRDSAIVFAHVRNESYFSLVLNPLETVKLKRSFDEESAGIETL